MKKLLALAATLSPTTALAHAGHGTLTDPVMHVLGEPAHALPLIGGFAIAVVAITLVAVRRAQKARARR